MCEVPSCGSSILPQKLFRFTDNYPNTQGENVNTGYFEELLLELLGNVADKSYLYVLPSLTKGEEDAKREAEKLDKNSAAVE